MLYTTPNTWVDDITVVTHVAQDCNHASVDWQVVAMVMSALNCVMRINRWLQLDKAPAGLCK